MTYNIGQKKCIMCVYWQSWVCLKRQKGQMSGCTPACDLFLNVCDVSIQAAIDIRRELKLLMHGKAIIYRSGNANTHDNENNCSYTVGCRIVRRNQIV